MIRIFQILLCLGAIFFFIEIPGTDESRFLYELYNFGHIIYFFFLILFILKYWNWLEQYSVWQRLTIILMIIVSISIITEGIQLFTERTADLNDIKKNFIGGIAAFSFDDRCANFKKLFRSLLSVFIFLLVLIEAYPVVNSFADEIFALTQYPVLSDFESPYEIYRWNGRATFRYSENYTRHGKKSLKIEFSHENYSGLYLKYFKRDWTHYRTLSFSIYNTLDSLTQLKFRLHDEQHILNGQIYRDRFNTSLQLRPGWNDIQLPLDKIKESPQDRDMNLSQISSFGFFVVNRKESLICYLDYVRLEK